MIIKNIRLENFINEAKQLCNPKDIKFCDGSSKEYQQMLDILIDKKIAIKLNKKPNSYLFRTHSSDVARVEGRTYISTLTQEEAGDNNNWKEPEELKKEMKQLYHNSMKGRTMYIIFYCMGPSNSPYSKLGVEITDSEYVVINMHHMTRVSSQFMERINQGEDFVAGWHASGIAEDPNQLWQCAPIEKKYISHFPHEKLIWSYGSGYGGNALLGKKCFALRIASYMAKTEGWLAEHMLIMRLISPEGKSYNICAAFPSACGKTNLAMLIPSIPGWKVECIGDDIAWLNIKSDGRLYAINPEAGFFGVAPGTSDKTNKIALQTIQKNTLFTNCALTDDGDVWWEGLSEPPDNLVDWQTQHWKKDKSQKPAAHPNARFTVSANQCPAISKDWDNPEGVPIDIIIFGGRRSHSLPLVTEAKDWNHGVFLAATIGSETTAASIGSVGVLRRDPFAMKPFLGYNLGEYFQHWINLGPKVMHQPKIFIVNWFRKNKEGEFIWPGFGENIRVLDWMIKRIENKVEAYTSKLGLHPFAKDINLKNLDTIMNLDQLSSILRINEQDLNQEINELDEFISQTKNAPIEFKDILSKMK